MIPKRFWPEADHLLTRKPGSVLIYVSLNRTLGAFDRLLSTDQSQHCPPNCFRQTIPGRDHALQISVKRRHAMTIETARMQRPCSARGVAFDANAIAVCS